MGEVMHPSGRVARALLVMRSEIMQALADAATLVEDTGRHSMKSIIAAERAALGLSLQEVADRAGITKSHMWELEQGRAVNPTIWTVYGLARALGVPFSRLAAGALNDTEDKGNRSFPSPQGDSIKAPLPAGVEDTPEVRARMQAALSSLPSTDRGAARE